MSEPGEFARAGRAILAMSEGGADTPATHATTQWLMGMAIAIDDLRAFVGYPGPVEAALRKRVPEQHPGMVRR